MNNILCLQNICKSFNQGREKLEILRGVDLTINEGEVIALIGPSGSGKSTLLQIAGLLEPPTSGKILLDGHDCSTQGDVVRTALRRDFLGFVYQYHNLLPDFNALENVIIPQLIAGKKYSEAQDRAEWLLSKMKLDTRFDHRPSELSGGEQQRVAIARALANTPKLLLADEPTGNLDPKTSDIVFEALMNIIKETGLAAVVATHNMELAKAMNKQVSLKEGRLVEVGISSIIANKTFY